MEGRECLVLVDAHVHVHAEFDVAALFDAAAGNFLREASVAGTRDPVGLLLLTECADAAWFDAAWSGGTQHIGRWRVARIDGDDTCLRAEDDRSVLFIVAGRQVVTREGIEVLTLATRGRVPDGQPMEQTLDAAAELGAMIVLPWGAGKWLGKRGGMVAACPEQVHGRQVWLGDNGGRPWIWPMPTPIARARRSGRLVLSGSDPLPLAGEEMRVGSFGNRFETADFDVLAPTASLRRLLESSSARAPVAYGASLSPSRFIELQLKLRARPRERKVALTSETTLPADIETSSANYASRFAGPAGAYLLSVQADAVRRALQDVPPGTALDVGGGHGQLVGVLRELGWKVTVHGSDPVCETNLRQIHGVRDGDFLLGDMLALPLPDASYDLVLAVRLVSHVDQWDELLTEMCRVARRAVLLDYPSLTGLNALTPLLFSLKKSLEGNTRTYQSFSRAQLAATLARNGFARLHEVKQFLLPMVVHRRAKGAAPLRWLETLFRAIGLTGLWGSPVILRADRTAAARVGS